MRWILAAVSLSVAATGCGDHHGRGDPPADGGTFPADAEGAPSPPGREDPSPPPDQVCAALDAPVEIALGPERGCEVRTLAPAPTHGCQRSAWVGFPSPSDMVSGAGVAVRRAAPGRVDLRTSGCDAVVHRLDERFCGRCDGLPISGPSDPSVATLRRFPDEAAVELVIASGTFDPGGAPCEVTLEVCFDPDYRPADWAEP